MTNEYRFEVALSFAGENRKLVQEVAHWLQKSLGVGKVFYDEWFEAEIAGTDAHKVLQKFYREKSRLIVPCVSQPYNVKPWTQDEWRAIEDLERTLRDAGGENIKRLRILPLRFGDGGVDGIFSTAIIPDVRNRPPQAIAELILQRLALIHQETDQTVRFVPSQDQLNQSVDLENLASEQLQELRVALMAAFPQPQVLALMVQDELKMNLDEITSGEPNYELAANKLVQWANAQGKVQELLEGARKKNPGNPKLKKLANLWLKP